MVPSFFRSVLELLLTPLTCVIGLTWNSVSVFVLCHKDFLTRSNRRGPGRLLIALAAADCIFLATLLPIIIVRLAE